MRKWNLKVVFADAFVSHVTYHLASLGSVALLWVKLSRLGIIAPAPTVSHAWVNPPSQACRFRWVRRHGYSQWDSEGSLQSSPNRRIGFFKIKCYCLIIKLSWWTVCQSWSTPLIYRLNPLLLLEYQRSSKHWAEAHASASPNPDTSCQPFLQGNGANRKSKKLCFVHC